MDVQELSRQIAFKLHSHGYLNSRWISNKIDRDEQKYKVADLIEQELEQWLNSNNRGTSRTSTLTKTEAVLTERPTKVG